MPDNKELFLKVLKELHKTNILNELILIGSWCLLLYKEYFKNPPEISMVRTHDIDFLIPNPPKIMNEVNVSKLLENLGFEIMTDRISGYTKYTQKIGDIEFLTPEKSSGKDEPYYIKKLNISAQGLRYLSLLQDYTFLYEYSGMMIKIPEPSVFVLHKFIISSKRTNKIKQEKDIYTAKLLGEYLINNNEHKNRLIEIFNLLPTKWQKGLMATLKNESIPLYDLLDN
jgi:hypothetical protein